MSAPRDNDPRRRPQGQYQPQPRYPQGHYPPQQYAQQHSGGFPGPAAPVQKQTRRWPWVVGGFLGLFVLIGACGGTDEDAPPAAQEVTAAPQPAPAVVAPVAPTEAAEPVVTQVILPEVEGRNGGIVYDELVELGLTNFDLASRDVDDTVVLLPQNWTAVSIEPGAGTEVDSDDTVIVTMTKEN